jgi:hypothetical protein
MNAHDLETLTRAADLARREQRKDPRRQKRLTAWMRSIEIAVGEAMLELELGDTDESTALVNAALAESGVAAKIVS